MKRFELIPRKLKQLSTQFSGLYYRRYVEGLESPLTKLLRKDVPFRWSEEHQVSFDKLKSVLNQASILAQLETSKDFVVYSDASHVNLGCV